MWGSLYETQRTLVRKRESTLQFCLLVYPLNPETPLFLITTKSNNADRWYKMVAPAQRANYVVQPHCISYFGASVTTGVPRGISVINQHNPSLPYLSPYPT